MAHHFFDNYKPEDTKEIPRVDRTHYPAPVLCQTPADINQQTSQTTGHATEKPIVSDAIQTVTHSTPLPNLNYNSSRLAYYNLGPDADDSNKCRIQVRAVPLTNTHSSEMSTEPNVHAQASCQGSILQRIDETSAPSTDVDAKKTCVTLEMLNTTDSKAKSPSTSSTESSESANLEMATQRLESVLNAPSESDEEVEQNPQSQNVDVGPAPPGFNILGPHDTAPPGTQTIRQAPLNASVMDALGALYDKDPSRFNEVASQIEMTNVYGQPVSMSTVINQPSARTLEQINPYDVLRVNINSELAAKLETEGAVTITRYTLTKRSACLSPSYLARKAVDNAKKRIKRCNRSLKKRPQMKRSPGTAKKNSKSVKVPDTSEPNAAAHTDDIISGKEEIAAAKTAIQKQWPRLEYSYC